MNTRRSSIFTEKGFTIVELAIVFVLVGILIALGIRMIGPLSKQAKVRETQGIIDANLESLAGYAAANRRLPTTGAQFTEAVQKPSDSWGNPFYYIVDASLTGTADAICGRRPTTLTVRNCRDDTCSDFTNIPNVAFIVLSSGANFNNQTAATQSVTATTTITVYEAGLVADNYAGDVGGVRPEPYDDIVKWVTVDELRTKIGCVGQQLRILNNELPAGSVTGSDYGATVYGGGGVPYGSGGKYRWCLQTATGNLAADLPGFSVTPNTLNADCQSLAEGSWGQADDLQMVKLAGSGSSGSYNITVFLRDNADTSGVNDNIAHRSFVITIHP